MQFTEVDVDIETGIVKVKRILTVQDCGLIVDRLTAESQVYGGIIGSLNFALFEDRILDRVTGQMVNPNMEMYLLAGMSDIPKIDIMLVDSPVQRARGVIGIGEPPTVSTASSIANAVRNATGATIRSLPLHAAQDSGGHRRAESRRHAVKAFEYANPTNEKDAVAALEIDGRIALPLAGGMDLLARMKDYVTSPDRVVNVKNALDTTIVAAPGGGAEDRRRREDRRPRRTRAGQRSCIRPWSPRPGEVGTPQIRNAGTVGGNINQRPRCWYFRQRRIRLLQEGRQSLLLAGRRKPVPRHLRQRRPQPHRPRVEPGGAVRRLRRDVPRRRTERRARRLPAADFFTMPTLQNVRKENVLADDEILTHVMLPAPGNVQERALRGALQGIARLAARVRDHRPDDERQHHPLGARRARRGGADAVALGRTPSRRWSASRSTKRRRLRRARPRCARRSR